MYSNRVIHNLRIALAIIALALCTLPYSAAFAGDDIYEKPDSFVSRQFAGSPPPAETLWITEDIRKDVDTIMQHAYPVLRVKYWAEDKQTVWVLEEIGKYKPITAGIAIQNEKISELKVLVYRESHGWQVRYPYFTDQFKQVSLDQDQRLSENIDGISGATMSVNALQNMAKLALYLDRYVRQHPAP